MTSTTTESYAGLRERLQAARQEAVGRRRANVLIETKDLSALLDRCIALEEALPLGQSAPSSDCPKGTDMRWTFDDLHLGQSSEGSSSLQTKIVARPSGLTANDWYNFAGKLCKYLNARRKP